MPQIWSEKPERTKHRPLLHTSRTHPSPLAPSPVPTQPGPSGTHRSASARGHRFRRTRSETKGLEDSILAPFGSKQNSSLKLKKCSNIASAPASNSKSSRDWPCGWPCPLFLTRHKAQEPLFNRILAGSDGLHPAWNQHHPGWVLFFDPPLKMYGPSNHHPKGLECIHWFSSEKKGNPTPPQFVGKEG